MKYSKVTNNSAEPIGIGMVTVLPGETVDVPVAYQENPTIAAYVAKGALKGVEVKAKNTKEEKEEKPKTEKEEKAKAEK